MVRLGVGCVAALVIVGGVAPRVQPTRPAQQRTAPYAADPDHLWNRIHQAFQVRTAPDGAEYGLDTVDPLLWRETRHLLTGPSHAAAVGVLDEFLSSDGERLIRDPLKRAVFQHDLWAIFDWLASNPERDRSARIALLPRVARVIRRVALTRQQIEALPDTSVDADLFRYGGPWVSVGGVQPLAAQHAGALGRSAFIVLWNVPGGEAATIEYLQKLWRFPQPFVADEMFQFARDGEVRAKLNPELPAVPAGTRIALVRKMLLVDDSGAIVPSRLVESIEARAFPGPGFSELRMSRAALFAGQSGGLRAVSAGEGDFITFSAQGIDPLERESWRGPDRLPRVLDGCVSCHHIGFEPAITTVLSLRGMLTPAALVDSRHERWARWFTQPIAAAGAKSRTYEWGLLQGWWQSQPR